MLHQHNIFNSFIKEGSISPLCYLMTTSPRSEFYLYQMIQCVHSLFLHRHHYFFYNSMQSRSENSVTRDPVKRPSGLAAFFANLCPCLNPASNKPRRLRPYKISNSLTENWSQILGPAEYKDLDLIDSPAFSIDRQTTLPKTSADETDDVAEYFSSKVPSEIQIKKQQSDCGYDQQHLILLGDSHKALVKIHTTVLKPSPTSFQKIRISLEKKVRPSVFPSQRMEQCWRKRYILFEKFDQGIMFDEESYASAPPEALASHISSRIRCKRTLNMYGGIGSYALKLSNTCEEVMVTDIEGKGLECIENNLGIYMADNVRILSGRFVDVEEKVDTVLLTPPWGINHNYEQKLNLKVLDISCLFEKALRLTQNVVMVLPSNCDVEQLAGLLAGSLKESQTNSNTHSSCSFEIERISFMGKIKHLVVYYGPGPNKEVTLSEELDKIYEILGNNTFKSRRISKLIREIHGLPFLLELALQAKSLQGATFHNLIELVKEKNILPQTKINYCLNKKISLPERVVSREEDTSERESEMGQVHSVQTKTYTSSISNSYDIAGLDATAKTIDIQCSQSIKHSSKLSKEDPSQLTIKN